MSRLKHRKSLLFSGMASVTLFASPVRANLLANSGFELPRQRSPGNNFPASLPNWTLVTTNQPCFNGHNVVLADGSAYDGGPELAAEGSQYYDICGSAGYISQSFTVPCLSSISFGASFSRRALESGGGSAAIYDATNTTLILESPAVTIDAGESKEIWRVSSATIPGLGPGTYVIRINIEDTANADATFVNATPAAGSVVGNGTPGSATEAALNCALEVSGSPVTFNAGTGTVVIPITATKTVGHDTTLRGGNKVTLSGPGNVQLFVVNPGVTLTLEDIILDHGYSPNAGGSIRNQGTLVLTNTRISNSVSGSHGGAIQNSGTLTCTACRFDYCRAAINGGAIDNTGTLTFSNSVATNNAAGLRGGGIYNYLGSIESTNSVFKWNSAGAYGGGMATDDGTLKSTGDRVRGNRSGGTGGGMSLSAGCIVRNTELSLNTAASFGGGLDVVLGTAALEDVRLYNNRGSDGGGIATHSGTTTVIRAVIEYNTNTSTLPRIYDGGGGAYVEGGSLMISDSRLGHNHSTYAGGAVMVNYNQKAILKNCIIANNTGSYGQLGTQGGTLEVEDCTIGPSSLNGIWCDAGTLLLSRSTIHGNMTFFGGGIQLRRSATATIVNSTISGNSSSVLGAGGLSLESGFGGSSADLTNVTIANNGGGNLYLGTGADVSLTVKNTIIANPASGENCAGKEITSSRYSISSDNLCALVGPGDRNGTNPLLGPLQNNGGATFTHMPLTGSPAIDGVLGTQAPALDQLGRNRPAGLGYDIGAVEVNAAGGLFFSPPPASTFDGNDLGDDDRDGVLDINELIMGTDPNSAASALRLSSSPANPFQMDFQSKAGVFYRLYVSPDYLPAHLAQWQGAGQGTIAGDGSTKSFTIVPAPAVPRRFYILKVMATDGPWP